MELALGPPTSDTAMGVCVADTWQLTPSPCSQGLSEWVSLKFGFVKKKKSPTHYFGFQRAGPKRTTSGFIISFVSWMGEAQIGAGGRAG